MYGVGFVYTGILCTGHYNTHHRQWGLPSCKYFIWQPRLYTWLQISRIASDGRLRLKCDGTRAETRFSLSAKRTSPFKSVGASVHSTTGSRVVRISGSNAGYTMFWGSVKSTGYPFHSPVSPSFPLPCVAVCHHISTGLYHASQHLYLFRHITNKTTCFKSN
jgi:hypothetical protein